MLMLQVPYKQLGIFFNVSETVHWLRDVKPEWKLHPEIRAEVENEARWWVPDVDIEDALINVRFPSLSSQTIPRDSLGPQQGANVPSQRGMTRV